MSGRARSHTHTHTHTDLGIEGEHNGQTNRERLEEEIGDLMCMIDLLIDNGIVSESAVMTAKNEKLNKLMTWSKIFEEKF